MKKFLALMLAVVMVFALCACGQKAEPAPAAEPAAAAPAAEPAAEPAADVVDLEMWCIATESDANHEAYVKATEALKESHPEVNLTWSAYENESYKTKIKAAIAADEQPDIFFTWAGAFLGDFVNAGKVYCLDDAYKAYADQLPEVMTLNATYNGGKYAVPLTMNVVTLFANMDLLAQVGWDEIPGTYEDFIKCCDDLKAAGIIPLGCSGKETWCVTEYLEPIMEKTIGAEDLKAIFALEKTWDDPDIAEAVKNFQTLVNNGYFDPDGIALGNDEVKANFLAGKYAFYQNGSWNCGEASAVDFKVQVGEFPVMNADRAALGQLIGGPSDSLAVSASSVNPELAAIVAFELGRDISHYGALAGSGLPAWTPDYDTSSMNPLSVAVSEMVSNSKGMVLFGDTAMGGDTANTYLDYVAQVYGGAVSPEDFVAGLVADIG